MPLIELERDWEEVPLEVKPIQPGTYEAAIVDANVVPTKDGTGLKVVTIFTITSSGEAQGRQLTDHVSIKNQTRLKRLALASGLKLAGRTLDVSQLVGRKARLEVSIVKVKGDGGKEKEMNSIDDYVV